MKGIYCIINNLTQKRYVGSSNNIKRRMTYHHKSLLRNGKHWNCHLQSSWNKYGEDSFEFLILEEVDIDDDLVIREQYWMDFYKACDRNFGYNLAPRADRTKHSPETISKMIATRTGKFSGRNAPMYGKKHTEESKRKISEAGKRRKGMKFSDSHKASISAYQKGRSWEDRMGKEKADELKRRLGAKTRARHERNRQIKANTGHKA